MFRIFEGGKRYLNSVYKYNLLTKKKTLLVDSKIDLWDEILSPDKKHILCIGGGEGTPEDFIYDIGNKETISINLTFRTLKLQNT